MFTGFNIKYPEYEVITPQTKLSYNVRSLTVQEEERLKGSLLSPMQINDHLNRCIFDTITKKPDHITDYESFLKNTTLKDRDALLYGLYHITYENIRNFDVSCTSCGKTYPITVKVSDTFNINVYPDDDILTKEVPVELPVSKGVYAVIRQPTLFDEADVLKRFSAVLAKKLDVLTESLVIKRFQTTPDTGDSVVYSDREDIIDAYLSLPSRDKRAIFECYRDNFGQYGISLKMMSTCIHCGNSEEVDIDLVENFFRMVYSVWCN